MIETIKVNNLGVLISPFGILEVIDAKKTDRWTEYMLEQGFLGCSNRPQDGSNGGLAVNRSAVTS